MASDRLAVPHAPISKYGTARSDPQELLLDNLRISSTFPKFLPAAKPRVAYLKFSGVTVGASSACKPWTELMRKSTTEEKEALLPTTPQTVPHTPRFSRKAQRRIFIAGLLSCLTLGVVYGHLGFYFDGVLDSNVATGCPQVDALVPQRGADVLASISDLLATSDYKAKAINWLSGAVQVPTEVFDAMPPVGQDPRWEVFAPFHDYLLTAFPLVNTYGLLFEWTGSDKSLKPILLAAHQDVVPVEPKTYEEWTHPPYSGHFDGELIWGRGSSDDKSGLIGIMTTIETMIAQGFKPTRTVVLAFGFDEEASGLQGAGELGATMRSTYGEDLPFAFIVDEGGGFTDKYGSVFASPSVAEKGYLDVHVEVTSPGGHSSVPPVHTTIGMLAALVVKYENNPYELELSRDSIPYALLQCQAAHGAEMPKKLKHLIRRSTRSKKALAKLRDVVIEDRPFRSLIGTTQAVDIVQGGVKSNALPEQAYALVNHRISTQSSVAETMAHDAALLAPLAAQFNLSYTAFGKAMSLSDGPALGTLTLKDAYGTFLEPAPVSPIKGKGSEAYQLLSGTIKATYAAHRGLDLDAKDGIAVAPGMSTGNTDTRYYWKLSRSIFRYNHKNTIGSKDRLSGVHTVNEAMSADALLEMIRFFTTLILNADESSAI
ncbi:Gly-X carboxypeptidase [Mycena venus]|uniref:Gly-X carboxypeptidase n=1 Tax=Mycena venus TaxID=2733690 RepID=A0A8H6YCR2_9AGAR|nr:Gly-X carboxypeptidase [Mycena venus]